ncbi:hypothetical protein N7532_006044 [Penicillium argentinense]|uniref:Uncharacterized protein n=1 Tax=Penicillium argentinense TaxID=1131581 RepID=A0A9W9KAJ0_9EURO|nr:uncharacterized protein N7532_006044 [Penicillium argentinense]KAJ5099043.1 hypothetical protein N7532_006044 [Penicillium argentinense]
MMPPKQSRRNIRQFSPERPFPLISHSRSDGTAQSQPANDPSGATTTVMHEATRSSTGHSGERKGNGL